MNVEQVASGTAGIPLLSGGQRRKCCAELCVVVVTLSLIHLLLWLLYLPLAHVDLSFYVEPAILLARDKRLAAPGAQYLDMTYSRGVYYYPPGYALLLASWIKCFGFGARSLLAFTNLTHCEFLATLWVIMRARFGCSRGVAALALASAFPMFNHGRPDLSALLFGALAWLVVPARFKAGRLTLSGALLGAAVMISPPYGISGAVAVAGYYFASSHEKVSRRTFGLSILTVSALVLVCATWATTLTWQHAWSYGVEQFRINSLIRGYELNQVPPLRNRYILVFCILPLVVLTFGRLFTRCVVSQGVVTSAWLR